MFHQILHHGSAKSAGCANFCCTRIENFGVKLGGAEILKDVNLHVHCGELTALIGANGAGKSTLLKAILGEVAHTGKLHYVDAKGARTNHPIIGYVPQYLSFDLTSPTTVLDLFMACLSNRPVWLCRADFLRERVEKNLARVQAAHLIDRKLGALSGGELQRVLLALALDPMPNLLLLDEPVSGVDVAGLELFYGIVSKLREEEDMAILLVSHDLALVEQHADRVVLMDHGVLLSGTPQEVFSDAQTRRIFGLPTGKEA